MSRFAPITKVAQTLSSALLVVLLIEASGLAVWAERLDVGNMRSTLHPALQTWQQIVAKLHLDMPRLLALELRDRWSGELVLVAAAPNKVDSSTAPPMETSTAAEKTLVIPSREKDKAVAANTEFGTKKSKRDQPQAEQVALVGDSMMAVGLGPVLRRSLAHENVTRFVRAYRSGTGLGRPDVYNWLEQYPQVIGAHQPALVICAIGANDAQNFQVGRNIYYFGTAEWKHVYAERVRDFAKLLVQDGARVLWLGMPVMRDIGFTRRMSVINSLVREVLMEFPQITWVDPNPFIAGSNGDFEQYRRDQNGKLQRLRGDDGIHLSEDGAAYLLPIISSWIKQTGSTVDGR